MDKIDIINEALKRLGCVDDIKTQRADEMLYNFYRDNPVEYLRNFHPITRPTMEYVMTIPDRVGGVAQLAAYTNRWGEECLFALGENGKTYLVDVERQQFIEAIAPKGIFR